MKKCYSDFLSVIYDQNSPIGHIGMGTHYSIFRYPTWLSNTLENYKKPLMHDFCVIWDEDHDIRIMSVIEKIYEQGLLSPIRFIGERKGGMTLIIDADFASLGKSVYDEYQNNINKISDNYELHNDSWSVDFGLIKDNNFSGNYSSIIQASHTETDVYLKNIDNMWKIGHKNFQITKRIIPL